MMMMLMVGMMMKDNGDNDDDDDDWYVRSLTFPENYDEHVCWNFIAIR